MPMLEIFEMVERLFAVKKLDVARLRRSEPSHRPAEMNEVWLNRRMHRVHPNFTRQAVGLARIAGTARGDHVRPLVRAAARQGNKMVAGERLARRHERVDERG